MYDNITDNWVALILYGMAHQHVADFLPTAS